MNVTAAHFILISLLALLSACGDGSSKEYTPPVVASEATPESEPKPHVTPSPPSLISAGVRSQPLAAFEVPANVRERLAPVAHEILPSPTPTEPKFSVFNQHIDINARTSVVTFTAVLRHQGHRDEVLQLSCKIEKAQTPWTCAQMFPTNPRIARQKRMQGTFECLDTYSCDRAGVKLWLVIDGKLQPPQLFQIQGFEAHYATSGDAIEEEPVAKIPLPATPPAPERPVVLEKPTQTQNPPIPDVEDEDETRTSAPSLTSEEITQALKDPSVALEITSPMTLPSPTRGEFSPPDIEKLYPEMGTGVANQAIGSHAGRGSYLKESKELPASSTGLVSRDHGSKDFGTNMTIDLLKKAAAAVNKKFPGQTPIVIANISNKAGGTIRQRSGRAHRSHKTGLDADIVLPSTDGNTDMWNACAAGGGHCTHGGRIAETFDEGRFWLLIKELTCAQGSPVIAMFLDSEIKAHMCRFARGLGEKVDDPKSCAFKALQALYHEEGHYNHVHVRFRCPGNRDCQNSMVTLGKSSGC